MLDNAENNHLGNPSIAALTHSFPNLEVLVLKGQTEEQTSRTIFFGDISLMLLATRFLSIKKIFLSTMPVNQTSKRVIVDCTITLGSGGACWQPRQLR